jgi:hypothetical protein
LRQAESEYPWPWVKSDAQPFAAPDESDEQQLPVSMRPHMRHLDIEAQQIRGPSNDQLLHRMVRAMRKVSPLWDI